MDNSLGFADLALASSLKHNRNLKLMEKLDKSIEWSRIEAILLSHCIIGTSGEGADMQSHHRPLVKFYVEFAAIVTSTFLKI